MAQLFIPQAPDLLGPAFNLQRLRQQGQQIEQQTQSLRTLEQYRQDQIREKKIDTWLKLSQRDPQAAKQFRDADPELSRILPADVRQNPMNQFLKHYGILPPEQAQAAPISREQVEFATPSTETNLPPDAPAMA